MFLAPKRDLFLDGWTYGDWQQFIVMLPGDMAQCCKRAWTPTVLSAIGLLLLTTLILAMLVGDLNTIGWAALWFAGMLQAPVVVEILTGSIFVVPLGPEMHRSPDGSFYRIFPCEVDNDR